MTYRAAALLLLFAVLTVSAVGCGDDEDAASGDNGGLETSSLTKAQYLKQANAICTRQREDLLTPILRYIGKRETGKEQKEAEIAADAVKKTALPKLQAMVDELTELGAPSGDEARVEEIIDALQQGVKSLERRKQLSLATDVDAAFKRSGAIAGAYGLTECS